MMPRPSPKRPRLEPLPSVAPRPAPCAPVGAGHEEQLPLPSAAETIRALEEDVEKGPKTTTFSGANYGYLRISMAKWTLLAVFKPSFFCGSAFLKGVLRRLLLVIDIDLSQRPGLKASIVFQVLLCVSLICFDDDMANGYFMIFHPKDAVLETGKCVRSLEPYSSHFLG